MTTFKESLLFFGEEGKIATAAEMSRRLHSVSKELVSSPSQLPKSNQTTFYDFVGLVLAFKPDSPVMEATWNMLSRELKLPEVRDHQGSSRAVRALVLTESILYMMSSTVEEVKRHPRYTVVQEAAAAFGGNNPNSSPEAFDQLRKSLDDFKAELSGITESEKPEDIERLIDIRHQLITFEEHGKPILELVDQFAPPVFPLLLQPIEKRYGQIAFSDEGLKRLLSGEFAIDDYSIIPFVLWTSQMANLVTKSQAGEEGNDLIKNLQTEHKLTAFFSQNQSISDAFWFGLELERPDGLKPELEADTYVSNLLRVSKIGPHVARLINSKSESVANSLATFLERYHNGSKNKRSFMNGIKKFAGIFAIIKSISFDSSCLIPYIDTLERHLDKQGIPPNAGLDILQDRKPGAIYITKEDEVKYQVLKPGQAIGSLVAEIQRNEGEVFYVSESDTKPDAKKEIKTQEKKPSMPLDKGEIIDLPLWGRVFKVDGEDIDRTLEYFGRNGGFDEEKLLGILLKYSQRRSSQENPPVLIPDLLPKTHELAELSSNHVIAMEQNGQDVLVLFSADQGIEAKANILAVPGKISPSGELEFNGKSLQSIVLLLNCAALLPRQSHTPESLTKEEISEVHGIAKDWNVRAKKQGLPQLAFEVDAARRFDSQRVFLPLGKKTTHFYIK